MECTIFSILGMLYIGDTLQYIARSVINMRKLLSYILILVLIIGLVPTTIAKANVTVLEETDENGYVWKATLVDGKATNVSLDYHTVIPEGNFGDIVTIIIPQTIEGYSVASIGIEDSSSNCIESFFTDANIQSLVSIDARNCTGLERVNKDAFCSTVSHPCTPLYSIYLPDSVKEVGENFMYGNGCQVYCNNPNIKFEGGDNTGNGFIWHGPTNSTAKEFYGESKYTSNGLVAQKVNLMMCGVPKQDRNENNTPTRPANGLLSTYAYIFSGTNR